MTSERFGEDIAKIVRQTPGQDTLRRFKYQLEYVALRWLESLEHSEQQIISELDEDAEVVHASIGRERIQVKTLESGYWSIARLTSKATPVLQSFAKQYAQDNELNFRFVSNGSATSDLEGLQRILAEMRSGTELTTKDKDTLRSHINVVRKRLGKHVDVVGLLERVEFDTSFAGIDDLSYRVRDAIGRASASIYNTILSPDRVERIHGLLLGMTLERSSSRYVGDRTLGYTNLDSLFGRETRLIEVPEHVDLAAFGEKLSDVAQRLERMPEPLLSDEERQRLRELEAKVAAPSSYPLATILVDDRMELADLLEQAEQFDEAEEQYAKALEEAQGHDETMCQLVFYCANFLARRNPGSPLLLPYVDSYLALALGSSSLRWVQAANVFSYVKAVHGSRLKEDYLRVLYEHLGEKDAEDLALVDALHWHEAMAMLEAVQRHPEAAVEHFRSLLARVDEEPRYPYNRLRNVLMATEPILRESGQFMILFKEFSDFCERKEAWGNRADLYKELAMRRYESGEYADAISLLRIADEGYIRVGATRGFLLARHVIAHCYRGLGRLLAAIKESLSLSLAADAHGVRDLAMVGLHEAMASAFDLGLLSDSFLWSIGYAKIANAYNDEAEMERAFDLLVSIYSQLARRRTREELVVARQILSSCLQDDDALDLFEFIELVAFAPDEEWERHLQSEADQQVVNAERGLRQTVKKSGMENTQEPERMETTVEGLTIIGDWSAQPELKWLVLGLLAWFEQYGQSLAGLFSEIGDTLELRAASFADASWAFQPYDYVTEMTDSGLPSALSGMTKDRGSRAVIVVPGQIFEATEGRIGELEFPCLMQAATNLRAMNLGDDELATAKRFEQQVLASHSFAHRTTVPLGTSQDEVGGFMLRR